MDLHDLRRTAATGMARLNFPPHVVDKILNHVSGTIRGVAAVYNRFEYLEERRAALEAWGKKGREFGGYWHRGAALELAGARMRCVTFEISNPRGRTEVFY